MLRLPWPFSRQSQEQSPSPGPGRSTDYGSGTEHYCDFNPFVDSKTETQRVTFGAHSTTVYGHPSTGGILVLERCNSVDLSFLGLARFKTALRSDDPDEEDRHCALMRQLGAWYFRSATDYDYASFGYRDDLDRRKMIVAAWPQGGTGVWVLVARTALDGAEKGFGMIRNATSMDERCEVVQKLGGKFYSDPRDCPDLDLK